MSSLFRATDSEAAGLDYPAYLINAVISNGSSPKEPEYLLFRGSGGYPVLSATDETAFLSAIKSFFSTHDWSSFGSGYTLSSLTVTKITELQEDVTPS